MLSDTGTGKSYGFLDHVVKLKKRVLIITYRISMKNDLLKLTIDFCKKYNISIPIFDYECDDILEKCVDVLYPEGCITFC